MAFSIQNILDGGLSGYTGSAGTPGGPQGPQGYAGSLGAIGYTGSSGSQSGDQLVSDENNNTFSINNSGDVVLSGEVGGVNRGLVWDYGAAAGGVNSMVRQDSNGLTVRAWTEAGPEPFNAPVNIVTNQDADQKTWVFGDNGDLTLPAGGTITEGYVTSNPTIQLTPATPDVASQKLVIKGGAAPGYSNTDNGIEISYDNNTAIVGDTLTFYINSDTYAGQTLYWWIYPEGANISDPGSGTVVLSGSGGSFSILIDSDDYEFTVRVSPEEDNYGPGVIGVETGLINADEPTFDVDYHLHLTTGNLAETSIFLGTDNHNVRTTVNGGIEINTYLYPSGGGSGKWTFDADGILTVPGDGIIQSVDNNGRLRSQLRLDEGSDITRLSGWSSPNSISFTTSDWTTGTYTNDNGSGAIEFTGAENIISWINANSYADRFFFSVNNGPQIASNGWGGGASNLTFYVAIPPATSPTTVTSFSIYYQFESRLDIDTDDEEFSILATGNNLYLETRQSGNIQIRSVDGLDLVGNGIVTLRNNSATNDIEIRTDDGGHSWNFGVDGILTFPDGTTNSGDTVIAPDVYDIQSIGNTLIQTSANAGAKTWTFGTTGTTTFPNNSIITNNTALKIASSPTTTYTFDQAYWEAVDGDAARVVTPTGNAQYFSCTVTANQNGTYTVAVTGAGNSFVPGNWFKVPGNELGGATPANDIQITVATVGGGGEILTVNPTGTAVGKQWQFGTDGTLTVPSDKGIQSAVDGGFQSSITLTPYRVLSQTVVPGNQSYSDSGDFVSATWTDNSDGTSTITFTSPAGEVVNFISTYLPRVDNVTVRINGAGAEYQYDDFNSTDAIVVIGAPASLTAVTEIRFSYQKISKIHIEPDDGVFDIISQPGTDIDIDAGDDLRILANDGVTITAGDQLQLRSTNAASITTNYGVDSKDWLFGTDGVLTLPGAVVNSTVAKTGVILPTTTGVVDALQHNSSLTGLTNSTYGPFTRGGVTFSVLVSEGEVQGATNISGTATVNAVLGTIDSGDIGGTVGTTITWTVDTVVQETPTALDLTKSVNKLTNGDYTLANGVEGQIMYLVRQTAATAATVTVANARLDGVIQTDIPFTPFTDGADPTNMATLIFTDSAWQSMGGFWNLT